MTPLRLPGLSPGQPVRFGRVAGPTAGRCTGRRRLAEEHTLTVPEEELPPPGHRIVRSELVTTVAHAGRTVLVDMGGGRRLTLDPFGACVWALLDDRPTLPLLLSRLRPDPTPAGQLAADLTRLVASWRALGVIAWRDELDAPAPPA